jgi:hypothetical protein
MWRFDFCDVPNIIGYFRNKIYWDRQLKLIKRLENIMGHAENILWAKEISYVKEK